jgi:hypothetical protein
MRDAAAGGDPDALRELAGWLARQPGREADVEQVWRDAAAAGDPGALRALTGWLAEQPGREAEAERSCVTCSFAGCLTVATP